MQVVGEFIAVIEIRKNEDREIQTSIEEREFRFLHLSAAIVRLKFCLDDVGMRDFAALLKIACQFQEAVAFVGSFLRRHPSFRTRRSENVIALNNGHDQTARCDFRASFGDGRVRRRSTSSGDAGNIERFMHIALADVFVHRIVRDESHLVIDAGSLCVDSGVVVVDAWQQGRERLFFVFVCDLRVGQSSLVDHAVATGTVERIRKSQPKRS